MNPVPFPAMKRQLIAILRGLKPQEAKSRSIISSLKRMRFVSNANR